MSKRSVIDSSIYYNFAFICKSALNYSSHMLHSMYQLMLLNKVTKLPLLSCIPVPSYSSITTSAEYSCSVLFTISSHLDDIVKNYSKISILFLKLLPEDDFITAISLSRAILLQLWPQGPYTVEKSTSSRLLSHCVRSWWPLLYIFATTFSINNFYCNLHTYSPNTLILCCHI